MYEDFKDLEVQQVNLNTSNAAVGMIDFQADDKIQDLDILSQDTAEEDEDGEQEPQPAFLAQSN